MSNVVTFRPAPRERATSPREGERGQIVFFTGVRYVREEDEGAAAIADTSQALGEVAYEDASSERLKA